MPTFVEAATFTGQIGLVMSDDEYARFQRELAADPVAGDPIPGLGGLRKVRWSAKGKGKSGGARIVYLHLASADVIYLFLVYTKGDAADLSPEQKRRLRRAVGEIKAEFSR